MTWHPIVKNETFQSITEPGEHHISLISCNILMTLVFLLCFYNHWICTSKVRIFGAQKLSFVAEKNLMISFLECHFETNLANQNKKCELWCEKYLSLAELSLCCDHQNCDHHYFVIYSGMINPPPKWVSAVEIRH